MHDNANEHISTNASLPSYMIHHNTNILHFQRPEHLTFSNSSLTKKQRKDKRKKKEHGNWQRSKLKYAVTRKKMQEELV